MVTSIVALMLQPSAGAIASLEFAWAQALAVQVGFMLFGLSSVEASIASPYVRLVIVGPAAMVAFGYFGLSLGYLMRGSGGMSITGYESFIGRRFLLTRSSPSLSLVTTISTVGVGLGVWLVLVSLAVLSGFENDLRTKIIGANGHLTIQSEGAAGFVLAEGSSKRVEEVRGVIANTPYIEGEVALASRSNFSGGVIMGIDPVSGPEVLTVLKSLTSGSMAPLEQEANSVNKPVQGDSEIAAPKPTPQVVIGAELARALSVRVGDTIRIISPSLQTLTPLGPAPKSQGLRVAAVFSSKMYEYDSRYAYVTLGAARNFFEREDGWVTGLQIQTEDPDRVEPIGAACLNALTSQDLKAVDWRSRNQTLFSALELERVVAFVVLVFIILVASFSIVTTLAMSIIEKRKEIAILKTMGSRDQDILKVFLFQGLLIGGFGTAAGAVLGIVTVTLLGTFGLPIPSDVYYLDSLPVHLGSVDIVVVVLAALLIVWDFAVFPALEAAELQPIEGLREG